MSEGKQVDPNTGVEAGGGTPKSIRGALLFHATGVVSAKFIIASGVLKASSGSSIYGTGVYYAESPAHALWCADRATRAQKRGRIDSTVPQLDEELVKQLVTRDRADH